MFQQSSQQYRIDVAPKPHLTIDLHNRDARAELLQQMLVTIDVDFCWVKTMLSEDLQSIGAQVTTCSCVKDYVHLGRIDRKPVVGVSGPLL